jgi:hypothetical protein
MRKFKKNNSEKTHMKDEGQYRFTNGIAIDNDLEFDRINAVVKHEFTHDQLYSKTTYGQIVLMLEKNSWLHNKSKEFKEILFDYMNRMQERTAVNVEIMYECIKNGLDTYNDAIESLQSRNRSYYNYFRKLCCINGMVNSEIDAKKLTKIVIAIATIALNVDPEKIPLDKINDKKSLKKYFDDPKYSSLISPNKRFDILVNILFRKNDNNNDIDSVIRGSINLEKIYDYDYIHYLSFQKISKILSDSPIAPRLIARIETIGVMKIFNIKGIEYLTVTPKKMNIKKELIIKQIYNKEEIYELMKEQEYKELFVPHSLGGFEDFHLISVYGKKYGKNIIYSFFLTNEEEFYRILSNTSCKFIFYKTKLLLKEAKAIRKMVKELPVYIYEDTPLVTRIQFIETFFSNGKFGFIENDNHYIFVVSKKSITLFANILKEAKDVLVSELSANNLCYIDRVEEICSVNEVIRLSKTCNEYEVNELDDATLVE